MQFVFLVRFQALPMLLDQRSLFENHCSTDVLTSWSTRHSLRTGRHSPPVYLSLSPPGAWRVRSPVEENDFRGPCFYTGTLDQKGCQNLPCPKDLHKSQIRLTCLFACSYWQDRPQQPMIKGCKGLLLEDTGTVFLKCLSCVPLG